MEPVVTQQKERLSMPHGSNYYIGPADAVQREYLVPRDGLADIVLKLFIENAIGLMQSQVKGLSEFPVTIQGYWNNNGQLLYVTVNFPEPTRQTYRARRAGLEHLRTFFVCKPLPRAT